MEDQKNSQQPAQQDEPKERAKDYLQLEQRIKEEVASSPGIQKYLEQFNPLTRSSLEFIYVYRKAHGLFHKDFTTGYFQQAELEWMEEAQERLCEIQQKKLFDLQCQWRAELITLPEILITYDFQYWEQHILNCPAVPPITDDELALYESYLLLEADEEFNEYADYQEYDQWKQERADEDEDSTYPDWYEYYDQRCGTAHLLLLPDIRGNKEMRYDKAVREFREAKRNAEHGPQPEEKVDTRPILRYDECEPIVDEMFKLFEKDSVAIYYNSYRRFFEKDDELDPIIHTLLAATEPVPIEYDDDWMTGLSKAAQRYRRKQVHKALHQAFEEYKNRERLGIGHPEDQGDRNDNFYKRLRDIQRNDILEGRELLGEPRDFNF